MEKQIKSPLNKGVILALILIAISVITYVTISDFEKLSKYGWINYLIIGLGIIWACWTYSEDMKNNVTFGNIFAHGFKTTAVLTSIMIVYTVLSLTVIFPEMKEKGMEVARAQMEANEQLSEAQIDQAMTMTEKFFLPFTIGGALVLYLILGAIASLIGAAIAKKNPNPTPFETDVL